MKHSTTIFASAVVLTTSFCCYSACSSDADTQATVQPATGNNGLPIPGNMMAMIAAANAGAGAGHSGAAATSASAGRPAVTSNVTGGAAGGSAGAGAVSTGHAASAGNSGSPDETAPGHAAGSGAAGSGAVGQTGAAGAAGQAAAGSGAAGSGAGAPESGADPCGPGAMPVMGANATSSGNGVVLLFSTTEAEIVSATMDMLVPKKPVNDQTLFIWPGIQPSNEGGVSGFGVLQPVLTWGGSCNGQRQGTWWISGQYVYFTGGFGGAACETGELMDVGFGDWLYVEFLKKGTVWTQNVTNKTNNKKVTFDRDLKGQKQVEVLWDIEIQTQNRPSEDVIFKNSVIKLAAPNPKACAPRNKGPNDWFSQPRVSADGMTCCIDKVILRAAGTMMTSPNEP